MLKYSDETRTGRVLKAKHPKVTIAARAESADGFQWFTEWRHDFCPGLGEVKSEAVLQIAHKVPAARERLLRGLGACPVFIVDLQDNTREMLTPLKAFLPRSIPDDVDLLEATQNPKTMEDLALGMLTSIREIQILRSSMWAVGSLMSHDWIRDAMVKADLGAFAPSGPRHQFDRQGLVRLTDKEFRTLVGRFSVALADALSPEAQAKAIAEEANRRFFVRDHVAYRVLAASATHEYVFDPAFSRHVTTALERAHGDVISFLRGHQHLAIDRTLRPGLVREEDSENVLGIQVADIAAGVAADMYERSGFQGLDAAHSLRDRFERVFLNRRWL